jgi:hypothetical protein
MAFFRNDRTSTIGTLSIATHDPTEKSTLENYSGHYCFAPQLNERWRRFAIALEPCFAWSTRQAYVSYTPVRVQGYMHPFFDASSINLRLSPNQESRLHLQEAGAEWLPQ